MRSDGLMLLTFATKRDYPIAAIRATIQLDHIFNAGFCDIKLF